MLGEAELLFRGQGTGTLPGLCQTDRPVWANSDSLPLPTNHAAHDESLGAVVDADAEARGQRVEMIGLPFLGSERPQERVRELH